MKRDENRQLRQSKPFKNFRNLSRTFETFQNLSDPFRTFQILSNPFKSLYTFQTDAGLLKAVNTNGKKCCCPLLCRETTSPCRRGLCGPAGSSSAHSFYFFILCARLEALMTRVSARVSHTYTRGCVYGAAICGERVRGA